MVKSSPSESNRGRNKELSVRKKNTQAPKQEIRVRTQLGEVRKHPSWDYRGYLLNAKTGCKRLHITASLFVITAKRSYSLRWARLSVLKPCSYDNSLDNSSRKEITLLSACSELKPYRIFAVILRRRYRGVHVSVIEPRQQQEAFFFSLSFFLVA